MSYDWEYFELKIVCNGYKTETMIFHFLTKGLLMTYEWKLMTVNPQERNTWRSGVRSASQLPGWGPENVDDASAPAC